jgi:hypothetical protein
MIIKLLYFCGWFGMVLSFTTLVGICWFVNHCWYQAKWHQLKDGINHRLQASILWLMDRMMGI